MSSSSNERAERGSPRAVFGDMLKFVRERAGLTLHELGNLVHMSDKTIGGYEAARRVPPRDVVVALEAVPELGANGFLLKLWDEFEEGMNYKGYPDWFIPWPDIEARATTLRSFQPLLVPGLLQTERYVRAQYATRVGITQAYIDAEVAARLKRQEILEREKPPMLWAILDEGVLHRPVGGPQTMAEQVTRLYELAQRPTVRIEIIPTRIGAHDGLSGAFVIADLPGEPAVAYREGAREGQVVRDAERVADLMVCWDTLRSEALSRSDSLAQMKEAAKS